MKGEKILPTWFSENAMLISTIVGVIFGVVLGFLLRPVNLCDSWIQLISYPGEMFTRALQMMILPLIISSLVVGSASLDAKLNGKIALRTLFYFITTSFLNAILGVILVQLVHPGDPSIRGQMKSSTQFMDDRRNTLMDNFLDLGRNIIPSNVFTALFQQTQTVYEPVGKSVIDEGNLTNATEPEFVRTIVLREGTNTLGIITFALLFGTILGTLGNRAKPVIAGFRVIDDCIMTIVRGIMWITPVGVASLISGKILSVEDIGTVVAQLGLFVLTVGVGILIYQIIILQLIYFAITRKNPFRFYWGVLPATVTAFSTASTAVALPVSFKCMDAMKVDSRVAHFILPIGATVNKDGTALFVAIASVFIAQMNGITLGAGDLTTVAITSTAVSVASASVPSAALALMFIVLNAIQVPTKDIGLLFAVDWLVDRLRTTNNLLGDLYAAVFVETFSQTELKAMDTKEHEKSASLESNSDIVNANTSSMNLV
ncbi:Excitatory amino acid transporter 2 [Orchesella cincta]|uniref:Amino acid transporter n=1 Tax=Orchesella cincta TaxID=48709 RepID=A0A1D2MPB6_ORCCI|nr:Excitatory amino acid transporter 2 [Orchesella cincta]